MHPTPTLTRLELSLGAADLDELPAILRRLAKRIESAPFDDLTIYDTNGNAIGRGGAVMSATDRQPTCDWCSAPATRITTHERRNTGTLTAYWCEHHYDEAVANAADRVVTS